MSNFLRIAPALLLALTLFTAGTALAADATTSTTANQAATASNFQNGPCWNSATAGTGRHMGRMAMNTAGSNGMRMGRMAMHASGFNGMPMAQGQHAGFGPQAMTTPATR